MLQVFSLKHSAVSYSIKQCERGIICNGPKLPPSTSLKLYWALSYLNHAQAEEGRPNTMLRLVIGRRPFRISCDKCFMWFSSVPPHKLHDFSLR